jgi:beta-lactamase class D
MKVKMKKIIIFISCIILLINPAFASENCFIAKANGKILKKEGDCSTSYGPQSTFKIVLSLIGFDSGILKDETSPTWSIPKGADPYINVCKNDHNPHTWMRDSCLWYSNVLTSKLGMEKFKNYINKFAYGNMDLSGGLTSSWVSSSLTISPKQYTEFLTRLVERKLPVSKASYDKTKNIMFVQELAGGWKLYGKTGNGSRLDKNGNKTDMQQGWFVGYIEKGDRKIVFASHIVDNTKQNTFASMRARNDALIKLWYIIDEAEK